MGDLRLALGMKHPHDVIDQMDLDLAMSGVFRAVPLLPDSEKTGTNSSLYRRFRHAGACLAIQACVGSVESSPRANELIHRDSML